LIGKAKIQKVLEIDPYNSIAINNPAKPSSLTKRDLNERKKVSGKPVLLSKPTRCQPGKTKVVG